MSAIEAVLSETARRGYQRQDVIALLTIALAEHWPDDFDVAGLLDKVDALPAGAPFDMFYKVGQVRGLAPAQWQKFKTHVYHLVPQAIAILDGKGDVATYGLPTGTRITYGSPGFPDWVYRLAKHFGLKASTYPGHQENHRNEPGFAPNPQRLNRGIDWSGPVTDMQRFADYLLTVKGSLEQVIWRNPHTKQRVGVAGGKDVSATGYYDADYGGHEDHVHTRQSAPIPLPSQGGPVPNRPDFNEFPMWSPASSDRGGTKVDLFLLHTQEGGGGDAAAENLARYLGGRNNGVSYHYTISQASDGGVTVVDVVDTDRYSWSVLSANRRSINLCFAGSRAAWSRADWLKQSKAIDVAAYLAVQDCKKYGIPTKVLAPPYNSNPPGISDHKYVTQWLKDGDHTDVGNNFPWDVFTAAVNKYASGGQSVPTPPKKWPQSATDRELLEYIADQLGPGYDAWGQDGDLGRNARGERRTFRAGVSAIMRKLGA